MDAETLPANGNRWAQWTWYPSRQRSVLFEDPPALATFFAHAVSKVLTLHLVKGHDGTCRGWKEQEG